MKLKFKNGKFVRIKFTNFIWNVFLCNLIILISLFILIIGGVIIYIKYIK